MKRAALIVVAWVIVYGAWSHVLEAAGLRSALVGLPLTATLSTLTCVVWVRS